MEYLLIVVGVSAVGIAILLIRNRKPKSMDAAIDEFENRRRALRPDRHTDEPGRV